MIIMNRKNNNTVYAKKTFIAAFHFCKSGTQDENSDDNIEVLVCKSKIKTWKYHVNIKNEVDALFMRQYLK